MQKIKVEIGWLDNYGAASEQVLGCVVCKLCANTNKKTPKK